MEEITLKPCCAICGLLWNNKECPLYQVYNAARYYGNNTFDEKAKYVVRCNNFILNGNYQ